MVDIMIKCIELSSSVREEEEDFLTRYCSFSRRVLHAMYRVSLKDSSRFKQLYIR
jgi:hypothetical protein